MSVREVRLTNSSLRALIDSSDYERVSKWNWCLVKRNYVMRTEHPCIYLHQFVAGKAPGGLQVEHKDRNGLNCVRKNLRNATRSQNLCNRGKTKSNTSGFKGVFLHSRKDKWFSQITTNGIRKFLGCYNSPIEAAMAYNEAAKELHGKFAVLNILRFPRLRVS